MTASHRRYNSVNYYGNNNHNSNSNKKRNKKPIDLFVSSIITRENKNIKS